MYLSSTAKQEGWLKKRWHTITTLWWHFSNRFIYSPASLFFLFPIVSLGDADINICAFEPWKLIIYERINKVGLPVVLRTAWKRNKTELMILKFLLTSWHYLNYGSFHSIHLSDRTMSYIYSARCGNKMSRRRGLEDSTDCVFLRIKDHILVTATKHFPSFLDKKPGINKSPWITCPHATGPYTQSLWAPFLSRTLSLTHLLKHVDK